MPPQKRPGPNEPCWCGSNRKYKQCHRSIDDAPAERKYAESQRIYASNWRVTAELQHKRGDYRWMAQQLTPFGVNRILDVGCGSGHGILSMFEELSPNLRIVAIDENSFCLTTARDTLRTARVGDAAVIQRVTTLPSQNGFRSNIEAIGGALPHPIALLESDVCSDPYLEAALQADGLFDAVTVWLSGVHMFRQFNDVVTDAGIHSDGMHRLFVQNSVYELANKVLRRGGVLQVVDRGEAPNTALLQEDMLRAHREQASPTALDVRTLAHTPWTPPETKRVPMVLTPGTSGRAPGQNFVMVSVISVKA